MTRAAPTPLLPRLAWPPSGEAEVEAAASEVRDWPQFIALARRENLLGLLAARLIASRPSCVPHDVIHELIRLRRLMNRLAVLRSGELLLIVEALEREGIPVLPIKGPALAQDLYGDPGLRSYVDLDLVVRPEDAAHAREALLAIGFVDALEANEWLLRRGVRAGDEIPLVGRRGAPRVDLHWRLTVGVSSRAIPTEHLLADARRIQLLGHAVSAPGVVDQLLVTALHGARHEWQPLELRLAVALQVARLPDVLWPPLCRAAEELGMLRRLAAGVAHACRPFGVPVPPVVRDVLGRDPVAAAYLRHLLAVRQPGAPLDLSTHASTTLWRVFSEDRVPAALSHLAVRLLRPGPEDWDALELPERLRWLYWPLRPVRLAVKWGRQLPLSALPAAPR